MIESISEIGQASQSKYEEQESCKHNSYCEDGREQDVYNKGDPLYDVMNVDEEVVHQLIFEKIDDAENFYTSYANLTGFDIRKQNVKRKNGEFVKNREWVCTRHGFRKPPKNGNCRKREPKPETRCGCKASFRVAHDRFSGHYTVTRFESSHNHPLQSCRKRYISSSDKSMLSLMTDVGIRPCHVMNLLEQLAGGAGKLSFRRKDGYNWLNKIRLEKIRGGDVNSVLTLFENMKLQDDGFVYKYTVDEEGALTRLFWCDGVSKAEYKLFGDVVAFDSTYNTNTYLYPLVLFSGVNSHGSTCIFGASFLYNETIESYKWLLQAFLEAMSGKIPGSVLTDQDSSMRAAILSEFPGTRHRLCSWHIGQNVLQQVKIADFRSDFMKLLRRPCSIEEFEICWDNLVEMHELSDHPWVIGIKEKKELWAEAYFRGHFMARMRSTQRAESMNSLIKLYVDQRMTLINFVKHYNRTLRKMRSDFLTQQDDSENTKPSVRQSPLKCLEDHAASICTKKVFYIVREEIKAEQGLLVESNIKVGNFESVFIFGEYKKLDEGRRYTVTIDQSCAKFKCECLMLESEGLPCRHIISAFKYLRIMEFPNKSIHSRWLIDTGKALKNKYPSASPVIDPQQTKFAQLYKECMRFSLLSLHTESGYSESLSQIKKLADAVKGETELENVEDSLTRPKVVKVSDPGRINTRGACRAKRQKCGFCGEPGHKTTTCQKNPATTDRRKSAHGKKTNVTKENSTSDHKCVENSEAKKPNVTKKKSTSKHKFSKNAEGKKAHVAKKMSTPEDKDSENLEGTRHETNGPSKNFEVSPPLFQFPSTFNMSHSGSGHSLPQFPIPLAHNPLHHMYGVQAPDIPTNNHPSWSRADFDAKSLPSTKSMPQNVVDPKGFPWLYPQFSHGFLPPPYPTFFYPPPQASIQQSKRKLDDISVKMKDLKNKTKRTMESKSLNEPSSEDHAT
ncbi:hypothetical protein ACJIZ3_019811 [Penstemon smallii]|uniref:SWIM-type domain-containing protein n=1 Tax=Penstemon smallii TaxID=265156 RepID=A0ABD3T271_9LAMI